MLKTNYHSHSEFCDGTGKLEDYVKAAISKGFDVFGFSGHAPLPLKNDWAITNNNLNLYLTEIERLKLLYRDRITLKTGLEIDFIEGLSGPGSKSFQNLNLDFIIGSVHLLKGKSDMDYLAVDYKKSEMDQLISKGFGGNPKLLVKKYYSSIRKMSRLGGFDIIGHLDVIKKNNVDSIYFDETEKWYKDEIKLTLQCIAENNQIIEINTGQVLKDPGKIYPSPWILRMANDQNIPVMINSDSHRTDRIDNFFGEAKTMILDAGYTKLKVLKGNKWEYDSII